MDLKKDQYIWNIAFSVFFIGCLIAGSIYLNIGSKPFTFGLGDFLILTLATFRVIRLFVYDKITAFLREPFAEKVSGPGKTFYDLLTCPWCFGIWAAFALMFLYMAHPAFVALSVVLAIAGVASFIQILANMIGWRAEKMKRQVNEGKY